MDAELFNSLLAHTLTFWWVIIPAILLGLVVGAIPGFSAANTIIILLPLTLAVDVEIGLVFMVALYCSSRMGAGIPAILVNIPGTAGAAATPLDGYPMTRAGRGQQALAISFVSSIFGGLLTTLVALFALPWLVRVVYHLHSVEMIVVMLFGISLIASIAARDTLKGLIAGMFGLMIGSIGTDHVYATPRATFGLLELYDGVPLIPALVGLFAPEAANNGVTAGTLVPLLTLGIPGGATAAIMLVVMQYHGVVLGQRLFAMQPELGYGVIMAMFVTYMIMIVTILPLARYMSHVTMVSTTYMAPIVIAFTLVGSFVPREYLFDMYLALVFGVIGYVARKAGYHVAAILIGVILGPLLEQYFLRALRIAEGDVMVIFSSRIGNVLWVFLVITIALPYLLEYLRRQRRLANAASAEHPSS